MSNLFQQLEIEAFRKGITPRTKESIKWFQKKAQDLGKLNRVDLLQDESLKLKNRPKTTPFGNMYMYFYDAKHKDTLPYYDRFPLTIMVGPAPKGFYGLNLHYLPLDLRARLLDSLLDNINNKKYDETTRFRLSYDMLNRASKLKAFKPCFKRYLTGHVRSRLARVDAPEWEIATFLPTADWEKSSARSVYSDSRKKMRA